MKEPTYQPCQFLEAERLLDYMLKNMEIQFQINGLEMERSDAVRHFNERQALITVKKLLLDEGERRLKANE